MKFLVPLLKYTAGSSGAAPEKIEGFLPILASKLHLPGKPHVSTNYYHGMCMNKPLI